jgi:hypothetical protein
VTSIGRSTGIKSSGKGGRSDEVCAHPAIGTPSKPTASMRTKELGKGNMIIRKNGEI